MNIDYILLQHGQIREKKKAKIYGVTIDLANSNPSTSVTYTDDAVVMLPGTSWDNVFPFNRIVPVLLNGNGVETAQLNKNDFSKNVDGVAVNITSGDNVMIKIPKIWYKIETVGNKVHCKISDEQVDDSYKCYAHSDGVTERDAFYVSAYLTSEQSNVLKSWSGKLPSASITLANSRIYARANGYRYNLIGFYQLTVLQILQLIRSKSLNSYASYGRGYTGGSAVTTTGKTDTKGMYAGSASEIEQVKIMGIEDVYGNLRYWIDGIKSDANHNLLTTKNPSLFSNEATGYAPHTTNNTTNVNGYISKTQGDTEKGFVIEKGDGSSTTYFTDNAQLYTSSFAYFGGSWDSGSSAGAFGLRISYSGEGSSNVGVRLMYL